MVIMMVEVLLVYLSSVPVYLPCADHSKEWWLNCGCDLPGGVWVQLLRDLGSEGTARAVLVQPGVSEWPFQCGWAASSAGSFQNTAIRVGLGVQSTKPHDSCNSAVNHKARRSSIIFQKEPCFGVRWIWVWILVLRLTSCVTWEQPLCASVSSSSVS